MNLLFHRGSGWCELQLMLSEAALLMGCHLVVWLLKSVAQFWGLILHQDNYSDAELWAQSLVHPGLCSMFMLLVQYNYYSSAHPCSHPAPQPRIRWDNSVMAAKHSPSKAQQFGGDSQLPETLEFSLVILKQFSPSFRAGCLLIWQMVSVSLKLNLPFITVLFMNLLGFLPPLLSCSKLLHPAHPHPAVGSSSAPLTPHSLSQTKPSWVVSTGDKRLPVLSPPAWIVNPGNIYLIEGIFSVISAGFPGWTQEYIPQPEAAASLTDSDFYSSSS